LPTLQIRVHKKSKAIKTTKKDKMNTKKPASKTLKKTPKKISEILGESVSHIKAYTIAREIDSAQKDFDRLLANLIKQYGADISSEIIPIVDLI